MNIINNRKKRGFTLVESLVTMIIIVLMVGVLFWMLLAGKNIWQNSLTRSANRQELQVAASQIEHELRYSNVDTITTSVVSEPKAFSFLSAFGQNGEFVMDSNGDPVWQKYVIYYIPTGTNRLLKREVYGNFTDKLTVAELQAYCNGDGKQISPSMIQLNLQPNLSENTALVTMTVESGNREGNTDRQTLELNISILN